MKTCEGCGGRFDRIPQTVKLLKDGTRFDPNLFCPSCESVVVKEASLSVAAPKELSDIEFSILSRECLRKDAFASPTQARSVAKRMRKRNHGRGPVEVYRCRVVIDAKRFPDRAQTHWHIGGVSGKHLN
jgi:hypothetical protein